MTLEDSFTHVRQLVQDMSGVHIERYEEQLLSDTRGNLRMRLRFSAYALLEVSEAIVFIAGELHWLSYRYHYHDLSTGLTFRYDNAPHHPHIVTHPHHKHRGDDVLLGLRPSIEQVLQEVQVFRDSAGGQVEDVSCDRPA